MPNKLTDLSLLNQIEITGYKKVEIPKNKFAEIDSSLCAKEHKREDEASTMCIAVYRDILVFKKTDTITGIAKICFTCDQNILTGAIDSLIYMDHYHYQNLYKTLH